MRIPAYLDLVDYVDPLGLNTTLFGMRAGEDWSVPMTWVQVNGTTPEDFTGRTFSMKIGVLKGAVASILYTGTSSDTKGQGGAPSISVPIPTNGVMYPSIASAYTGLLSPGMWQYGIYDVTAGKNELMIEGQFGIAAAIGK